MKPVLDIKNFRTIKLLGVDENINMKMESVLIKLFMHIN